MATETPKIALVYNETGDGARLPFISSMMELLSLVEPAVSCEIFPAVRLVFEQQKHSVSKVVVFMFGKETDFPAFPVTISQYFNTPTDQDYFIVSQCVITEDPRFTKENVFFAKNLVKATNDWCPEMFQRLFPKMSRESIANKDIIFVCDASSKADIAWCQGMVSKVRQLGGQAVCPGTEEWTSADAIMATIKPTTLVVLVPNKDGSELLVKFGPLIGTARGKAKVLMATKNVGKIIPDVRGKEVTVCSRDQPVDLWLEIMCHLAMVSCTIKTPVGQDDAQAGFIMPFAKPKLQSADGEGCNWMYVLMIVLFILLLPIFIVLMAIWCLLGMPKLEKMNNRVEDV